MRDAQPIVVPHINKHGNFINQIWDRKTIDFGYPMLDPSQICSDIMIFRSFCVGTHTGRLYAAFFHTYVGGWPKVRFALALATGL